MRKILLTLIMGFSFFGLFAQTEKFKTVDVEEFAEFIKSPDVVVLDVRTPAENAQGFIPGTHFNIDVLAHSYTKIALEKLPKDKPVALYCRSGNRSKNAARILAEKGYKVVELGTGFRGWTAAGLEVSYPEE
jgi:rhodanese-related sulfurtransferase